MRVGDLYTKKLPKKVQEGMKMVSKGGCYKVKRQIDNEASALECHKTVKQLVDRYGGAIVSGWILGKNKILNEAGIYPWTFHSIWKSPNSVCYDVTKSTVYKDDEEIVFWPDELRRADIEEGTSYNNIIMFSSDKAQFIYEKETGKRLSQGTPWWTDNNLKHVIEFKQHSGQFRILHSDYPKNIEALESQYECEIKGGRIVSKVGRQNVPFQIFFDFSLS